MVRDYTKEDAANRLRALSESAAKRNPSQQFVQRPASLGGVQEHKPTKRNGLMSVLDMTPAEINCEEWRAVGEALQQAQDRLQADGSRQTWLDWAVQLCRERGKYNATVAEPEMV